MKSLHEYLTTHQAIAGFSGINSKYCCLLGFVHKLQKDNGLLPPLHDDGYVETPLMVAMADFIKRTEEVDKYVNIPNIIWYFNDRTLWHRAGGADGMSSKAVIDKFQIVVRDFLIAFENSPEYKTWLCTHLPNNN